MDFTAKNVYFRASDSFYIHIPYMVGKVVSFLPEKLIIPEKADSFELQVSSGQLRLTQQGMESHIVHTLFKPLKKMLASPTLQLKEPNLLILKGHYLKRIPFKITFEAHLNFDNKIHCVMQDISAVGMPIQSLLKRFNISLGNIVNMDEVSDAVSMTEREVIIDPTIFVPGLKLQAMIQDFRIEKETFVIQYGNGYISQEKDLECPDGGYLKLDGGYLQVSPFTIRNPDVLIWSPHYPFAITYDGYPYLFAVGRTEIKLNKEIILRLPELSKFYTLEDINLINTILPQHLKLPTK